MKTREVVTRTLLIGVVAASLSSAVAAQTPPRAFASPEEAVRALADSVAAGNLEQVLAIFGSDGKELIDSSDAATARKNQEVFTIAFKEGWRLIDQGKDRKTLVIGNEAWPFPVPLVKQRNQWHFDTAAGKEEIIARRIGRNELQVIAVCREYVTAQRRYAEDSHDGVRAGAYAQTFRSDPGKQNGLYWPATHGAKRSPLGDLVAQAATEGRSLEDRREPPSPFHGYYFRILTAQGKDAPGGAKSYLANGVLSGGFAMVAWPAQYNVTGVMTFIVNQDGVLRQKDNGEQTDSTARAMTVYNPDKSWSEVE